MPLLIEVLYNEYIGAAAFAVATLAICSPPPDPCSLPGESGGSFGRRPSSGTGDRDESTREMG